MVDRIRELLLARQLSPTQFADTIGVARPIVSHILSGRNKPSLEVVQKILAAFPDLGESWLLRGTGPMRKQEAPQEAIEAPIIAPVASQLASGPLAPRRKAPATAPATAAPGDVAAASESFPIAEISAARAPAAAPPVAKFVAPVAAPASTAPAPPAASAPPATPPATSLPPELALFAEPGKAIRRIVIFYRDGTFADYQPE